MSVEFRHRHGRGKSVFLDPLVQSRRADARLPRSLAWLVMASFPAASVVASPAGNGSRRPSHPAISTGAERGADPSASEGHRFLRGQAGKLVCPPHALDGSHKSLPKRAGSVAVLELAMRAFNAGG